MPDPTASPSPRTHSRVLATLKALIRTRITAGLLTVLPIIVTLWLLAVIFRVLRDASRWVVMGLLESNWFQENIWKLAPGTTRPDVVDSELRLKQLLFEHPWLDWGISIFSVLLTFFLLYLIGLFTANLIGRRVLEWLELLVDRLPLVKTIYRTLKQIAGLFSGDQTKGFQRVALVPFPSEKTRSVAFITNTMRDSISGEELCCCFIATTPNPTTGFVFMLRRSEIIEVNWSVEEAIKLLISGGILAPTYITMISGPFAPARAEAP